MFTIPEPLWDLLRSTEITRVTIRGGSMYPFLRDGDVLQVLKSNTFRKGQIIVFNRNSVLVAHRIVKILKTGMITRGDASRTTDFVGTDEVLGRVLTVTRGAKLLGVDSFTGQIYALLLPVSALAWRAWGRIKRSLA